MRFCEKTFNTLWILVICGVLLAAFGVQLILKEMPCPLCLLQRLAMISIACSALLNLRFGVKTTHYSLALLSSIFGGSVSLRQIALHVCPDFTTFGSPVLGLSLFSWAFLVFCCSIAAVAFLMFFYDPKESPKEPERMSIWENIAAYLLLFVAAANIISTLVLCGLDPCSDVDI